MYTDNVIISAIFRNFKSDTEYLDFGDFWIQSFDKKNRLEFSKNLEYCRNYPFDKFIACQHYYIGRGEALDYVFRQKIGFWYPLFRFLKLFKGGDLIIPSCFSFYKRMHEIPLHGDSYGLQIDNKSNLYILGKEDIEPFNTFRKEINKYLNFINLYTNPFTKQPEMLNRIDMRCLLAIHLLLKNSVENHNPYAIIDCLIDYTIALESLFLSENERSKKEKLSSRIATLLSKDKKEEELIHEEIKKLYTIRGDIVHGSQMTDEGEKFLKDNIFKYGDYLRKSILAFLDLNKRNRSKKEIIKIIDNTIKCNDEQIKLQDSLNLLKLAR
jgi:hypothetical protein